VNTNHHTTNCQCDGTHTDSRNGSPLFVGLNGTLVAGDVLWEFALQLVRIQPSLFFALPFWFAKGESWWCEKIAHSPSLDPASLPYRHEVLDYLTQQKAEGRRIVLVTRTHACMGKMIAEHLGCFDQVMAANGREALVGKRKLREIEAGAGTNPFEFIGDHKEDLPVIEASSRATLVNPSPSLAARAKQLTHCRILGDTRPLLRAVLVSLRPHHWIKNLLLAVPAVLAHVWNAPQSFFSLFVAILTFSLVASAVYVCNDLLDLPADRLHPTKKERPLAKGELPIPTAILLALSLFAAGLILGLALSSDLFLWLVVGYAATALAYSLWLKRCIVLDVVVLAGLYGLRIFAGGAVVGVEVSAWLLAFSGFFFLSLAFAKRYLELALSHHQGIPVINGNRPYSYADLEIFRIAGTACGLLSVLVLALYINSTAVRTLYRQPNLLWLLCPLLLYWILRTWVLVLRGEADSDPVVFALRDKASLAVAFLTATIVYLAI
jgi:4-hydroxybenzoate polyprenyltransferase